mgnify:CR=1 FL=1
MKSLNVDSELWTFEVVQEPKDLVGPLCCWWVECWD